MVDRNKEEEEIKNDLKVLGWKDTPANQDALNRVRKGWGLPERKGKDAKKEGR